MDKSVCDGRIWSPREKLAPIQEDELETSEKPTEAKESIEVEARGGVMEAS